jgi:hypothetical protein
MGVAVRTTASFVSPEVLVPSQDHVRTAALAGSKAQAIARTISSMVTAENFAHSQLRSSRTFAERHRRSGK